MNDNNVITTVSFKYAELFPSSKGNHLLLLYSVHCLFLFYSFPSLAFEMDNRSSFLYLWRRVFCTPCHVIENTTDLDLHVFSILIESYCI